jgi:hypothetical protein
MTTTIVLVSAVACGLLGASSWAIPAAAFGMTCMRIETQDAIVAKHAQVLGGLAAWCLFIGATFAGNLVACGTASLAGWGLQSALALAY